MMRSYFFLLKSIIGKIGVNGTAYRSNRNTYRLKRYTFPHIINLYFYCFPPFAILMM